MFFIEMDEYNLKLAEKELRPKDSVVNNYSEYRSVIHRILEFFKSILHRSEVKNNDFYIAFGKDDEEKRAIKDSCEDIDNYYDELVNLSEDDRKTDEYLVSRLTDIVKEDNIEENEKDVRAAVNEFLNRECEEQSEHILDVENIDLKEGCNGNQSKL